MSFSTLTAATTRRSWLGLALLGTQLAACSAATFSVYSNAQVGQTAHVQAFDDAISPQVCLASQVLDPFQSGESYNMDLGTNSDIPMASPVVDGLGFKCGSCKDRYADFEDDARYFELVQGEMDDYVKFTFVTGTRYFMADVWINAGWTVDVYCDAELVGSIVPESGPDGVAYDNQWGFIASEPCSEITLRAGDVVPNISPAFTGNDVEIFLLNARFACQDGPKTGGDPHFQRWNHKKRDSFHGQCDLVLLHQDSQQDAPAVDIHIRTTIRDSYSYIEAAAVQLGSNVVEFQVSQHNVIYVNGQRILADDNDNSAFPIVLSKNDASQKIVKVKTNDKWQRHMYHVQINRYTSAVIKYSRKFMTVSLQGSYGLEQSVGMLGEYGTGDLVARDGITYMDESDYSTTFGWEWQVRTDGTDPILFQNTRAPQWPQPCQMPIATPAQIVQRRKLRGGGKFYVAASEACAQHQPDHIELCVQDVLLTGDLDWAEAW